MPVVRTHPTVVRPYRLQFLVIASYNNQDPRPTYSLVNTSLRHVRLMVRFVSRAHGRGESPTTPPAGGPEGSGRNNSYQIDLHHDAQQIATHGGADRLGIPEAALVHPVERREVSEVTEVYRRLHGVV